MGLAGIEAELTFEKKSTTADWNRKTNIELRRRKSERVSERERKKERERLIPDALTLEKQLRKAMSKIRIQHKECTSVFVCEREREKEGREREIPGKKVNPR